MNKIRVIDLLNKIANGEEVPKKVKYDGQEWEYNPINDYEGKKYGGCLLNQITLDHLTDEVEILEEEKKIPEKIEIYEDEEGHYFIDKHCKKIYITCDEVNFMVEEFNQLIDYLKSKGE